MRAFFLAAALITTLSVAPVNAGDQNANPMGTTSSDPEQAVKCRKVAITGSLVRKAKICRTLAEWNEMRANGNRTLRSVTDGGTTCAGGFCGNGN
jgi:hypothetical protein